jgi:CelD/BcsL family acetyltransferase involved in cellulose biosynthesis
MEKNSLCRSLSESFSYPDLEGWLNLSFLKFAGKEIAAYFSFDFEETEYVYNSGYDPQFRRFSPGIILAAQCIRRAIEKRMVRFNFLRGGKITNIAWAGKRKRSTGSA